MSIYSNRATAPPEQAQQYVRAVVELAEGQDCLAILAETAGWLQETLASVSDEERMRPEAPGKWSIAHVVHHLADSELVWGYRLRRAVAEDRPRIASYDQDLWAERLRYEQMDPAESLELFATLRNSNLRLLRLAGEGFAERAVVHEDRGEETIALWLKLYAGHDIAHRRQIERIRSAVAPK